MAVIETKPTPCGHSGFSDEEIRQITARANSHVCYGCAYRKVIPVQPTKCEYMAIEGIKSPMYRELSGA